MFGKSRFIAGSEITFDNEQQFQKILLTHGINKIGFEFFKKLQSGIELIINNETIIEIIEHIGNKKESKRVNYKLPLQDWLDRSIFFLQKLENGTHTIGGETPADFKIPDCDVIKSPFVYIATIRQWFTNLHKRYKKIFPTF